MVASGTQGGPFSPSSFQYQLSASATVCLPPPAADMTGPELVRRLRDTVANLRLCMKRPRRFRRQP
jgi:hypothetical protein